MPPPNGQTRELVINNWPACAACVCVLVTNIATGGVRGTTSTATTEQPTCLHTTRQCDTWVVQGQTFEASCCDKKNKVERAKVANKTHSRVSTSLATADCATLGTRRLV